MSFIKTAWDTWWMQWTWPLKVGSAILALILIGLVIGAFKSCLSPAKPKLDEKTNQQVHEAIETRERKMMEDAFVAVEVKQAQIEANVTNSKVATINTVADAKKQVSQMSDEELAAYLESIK